MTARLSHLNEKGEARMVDVSAKDVTSRTARAEGFVAMAPATLELILAGEASKGDVLATARIAGIMAAKRTDELIPLCHSLPLSEVRVEFEPLRDPEFFAEVRVDPEAHTVVWPNGADLDPLVLHGDYASASDKQTA